MEVHTAVISQIAFSNDSTSLATCSGDKTCRIWNLAECEPRAVLRGHTAGISDVCWHPQVPAVATAADDKSLRVWDVEAGVCVRELLGHSHFVYCCKFHTHGSALLSGSLDERIMVWDVRSGRYVHTIPAHCDPVTALDCCRDGTVVASVSADGLCRLWDIRVGKLLRTLVYQSSPQPLTDVEFSDNSRYILQASVGSKPYVYMWDWAREDGALVRLYENIENCISTNFLSGRAVLSVGKNGDFQSWELSNNKAMSGALVSDASVVRSWCASQCKERAPAKQEDAAKDEPDSQEEFLTRVFASSLDRKSRQIAVVQGSSREQMIKLVPIPHEQ